MNKILVEVSVGELLDKISILEIKKDRIKDNDKLNPDHITEALDFADLQENTTYRLRRKLHQNDEIYNEKTECLVKNFKTKIYGIDIYEGYVNADKVYVCADDVY